MAYYNPRSRRHGARCRVPAVSRFQNNMSPSSNFFIVGPKTKTCTAFACKPQNRNGLCPATTQGKVTCVPDCFVGEKSLCFSKFQQNHARASSILTAEDQKNCSLQNALVMKQVCTRSNARTSDNDLLLVVNAHDIPRPSGFPCAILPQTLATSRKAWAAHGKKDPGTSPPLPERKARPEKRLK